MAPLFFRKTFLHNYTDLTLRTWSFIKYRTINHVFSVLNSISIVPPETFKSSVCVITPLKERKTRSFFILMAYSQELRKVHAHIVIMSRYI